MFRLPAGNTDLDVCSYGDLPKSLILDLENIEINKKRLNL